jgi:hypothetical protein
MMPRLPLLLVPAAAAIALAQSPAKFTATTAAIDFLVIDHIAPPAEN